MQIQTRSQDDTCLLRLEIVEIKLMGRGRESSWDVKTFPDYENCLQPFPMSRNDNICSFLQLAVFRDWPMWRMGQLGNKWKGKNNLARSSHAKRHAWLWFLWTWDHRKMSGPTMVVHSNKTNEPHWTRTHEIKRDHPGNCWAQHSQVSQLFFISRRQNVKRCFLNETSSEAQLWDSAFYTENDRILRQDTTRTQHPIR